MKSVVATIGMFAALANAHYQAPRHFHFRRDNGTDTGMTTLTVIATEVHTITSCAPTITNCPANDQTALASIPASDKTTIVVTNTVVLTTTVCPVTEAGSISSSIISKAQTGGITGTTLTAPLTHSVPLGTGVSPPVTAVNSGSDAQTTGPGGDEGSSSTITTDIVTDKTLTLTLGTGTDASVVTTTLHSTIHTTIVVPCTQTGPEGPAVTDDGSKGTGDNTSKDDQTTTVTATSTGYVTKTVSEASITETETASPSGSGGKGTGDNGGSGDNGGNGSCECNGATATVTVTESASTVYVTVGAGETGSGGNGGSGGSGSHTSPPDSTTTDDSSDGNDGDDGDDGDDDSCDDDATTTLEATVTVVPYPTNGTHITSGIAGPTGFARLVR